MYYIFGLTSQHIFFICHHPLAMRRMLLHKFVFRLESLVVYDPQLISVKVCTSVKCIVF